MVALLLLLLMLVVVVVAWWCKLFLFSGRSDGCIAVGGSGVFKDNDFLTVIYRELYCIVLTGS